MTDTPFQWGRSTCGWTADGYILELQHVMEERVLMMFETSLHRWLSTNEPAVKIHHVTAMHVEHQSTMSGRSTRAEPGVLQLIAPDLFDVDAQKLRDALDRLAGEATDWWDLNAPAEQEKATAFLDVIRGQKPS